MVSLMLFINKNVHNILIVVLDTLLNGFLGCCLEMSLLSFILNDVLNVAHVFLDVVAKVAHVNCHS